MMRGLYKLDRNRKPVRVMSAYEWGEAMQDDEARRVGLAEFEALSISTCFIGVDYSFGRGPLRVFETAAFDQSGGVRVIERYATWEEAEAGHAAAVAAYKAAEK